MRFNNYDVVDQTYVSASLKKFYSLGKMYSLLVLHFLTGGIGCYRPELVELLGCRKCASKIGRVPIPTILLSSWGFRDILSLNIF